MAKYSPEETSVILDAPQLKRYREATGRTQEEFAALIGMKHPTYRDIEQGKTHCPTLKNLKRIANGLRISYEKFTIPEQGDQDMRSRRLGRPKTVLTHFLVGSPVDAGRPNTEADDGGLPSYLAFTDLLDPGKEYFFFPVSGNSMNLAGIRSGDYVLIRSESDIGKVKDGEIVLVRTGGGKTLKILSRQNGVVTLSPHSSDPRFKPIQLSENEPGELLGVRVAVVEPQVPVGRHRPPKLKLVKR